MGKGGEKYGAFVFIWARTHNIIGKASSNVNQTNTKNPAPTPLSNPSFSYFLCACGVFVSAPPLSPFPLVFFFPGSEGKYDPYSHQRYP